MYIFIHKHMHHVSNQNINTIENTGELMIGSSLKNNNNTLYYITFQKHRIHFFSIFCNENIN